MPKRPCLRAVALENRAFLRHLRATGNAHEAARRMGCSRSRFTKRGAAHPAFAARWDAALAVASAAAQAGATRPGTPRAVRTGSGRLQLRRATPGRLTEAAQQAFLAALAATANIRLAAAAAGFSHSAFYQLKARHPGFARERRLALAEGYDRIEAALLESAEPAAFEDDAWRHNERPATPPLTAGQALQLMYLHQKEARLLAEPDWIKRRRGETPYVHRVRMKALREAERAAEHERYVLREAEFRATGVMPPHEPPPPLLPDLAQVTGWSQAGRVPHVGSGADSETAPARPARQVPYVGSAADGETAPTRPAGRAAPPSDAAAPGSNAAPREHHPERALFGGWRIEDIRAAEAKSGKAR